MAKIRAYKLAEELGLDRAEFVEKAAALGVELKSAMASLDEDVAEKLRKKLCVPDLRVDVSEKRVEGGGGAVIRRRKKKVVEPAPIEVRLEPEPALAAEPEPALAAEPEPALAAEPELRPEDSMPTPTPAPERPAAAAAPAGHDARSAADSSGPGRAGARKQFREVVNLREQERLARQATSRAPLRRQVTLEPRSAVSPRRRPRDTSATQRPAATAAPKEDKRVLRIEGSVSVGELARMLGQKAPVVQSKLMALGTLVSINQAIDAETASNVASEFGWDVQDVGFREEEFIAESSDGGAEAAEMVPRPPVVTVMGHVDHGKTSLLDAIRRTKVVEGEAGGITQHIGAYQVSVGDQLITFIDTPGHAAFTDMRARGAQVTDLVILVVAASEGAMPQTVEAIDHAKAAGVPIVVAVNKCDLPGANPQQTRQRLMEHELVPEEFGGDTLCVDISALKGTGLDQLLEAIVLQSELLEIKAAPSRRASGVVLEARLDKGRGPVATVLVHDGTLTRGDVIVVGTHSGRVRALEDENGKRVDSAPPGVPVQVIGLSAVPEAGQKMNAVENERVAKDIVDHRTTEQREKPSEGRTLRSLEDIFAEAEGGGVKDLTLVVKADVHGSVEALREALLNLSTDDVKVDVIHSGVGAVTETDVMLARASGAIVVAFHVRPEPAARRAAESQGVEIRAYKVIYEVTEDVQKAMVGLLPLVASEVFLGRAEIRKTFSVPRAGTVAGCYITEGQIRRNAKVRLLRDGVQVYDGRLSSLKRFKDDVREVQSGFECGMSIDGYNDVKVGDVIEAFVIEEKPATL